MLVYFHLCANINMVDMFFQYPYFRKIKSLLMKKIMVILLAVIAVLGFCTFAFTQQSKFGKLPKGERLDRIKESPNYRDGSFQNLRHTPTFSDGVGFFTVAKAFFSEKNANVVPVDTLPSEKTDLLNLDPLRDVLVWFGHSSYFIQIDGKRILVDPVFSGSATPLPFGMKAFAGSDVYTTDDIPAIDYLFITHDHWDHLDYETILKLKPKINKVICGLGVGATFESWGYDKARIIEEQWNAKIDLDSGFTAYLAPARHFSGRGLQRNKTLWTGYVLETPTMKFFICGDSGYDVHFAEIGRAFGSFDLAILENGQYDKNWKYIHMSPEETIQAAKDLNAKRILPVHSSKFALANHAWDEPLARASALAKAADIPFLTPVIGAAVNLKDSTQVFTSWWESVK